MKWIIFSIAFFLVIACEFESKDIYFVDLNRETYGDITIDLLNQPDTIVLLYWNDFSFKIAVENDQVIYNSRIIVDGEVISNSNSYSGTFTLNSVDYETGFHTLKIEVNTSSGTGSMADLAGAESLFYEREWIFVTDHRPLESIEIKSIAEHNGRLRIEWSKIDNLNFSSYVVCRNVFFDDNVTTEAHLATIVDQDSTVFDDESYVGGPVMYRVENLGGGYGILKSFNGPYPKLSPVIKSGVQFKFKWDKTRFPGNFGQYELSYKDLSFVNQTFFSSDNPDDTSCTFSVLFGDTIQIRLNTISNNHNPEYHWAPERICDKITVYAGDKIPRHNSGLIHSNDPGVVYLLDCFHLKRYNLETGIVESNLETEYDYQSYPNGCISPNGNYLLRSSGNIAYLLDPLNLSTIETIDLSRFFSGTNSVKIMSVSNNGLLSVSMCNKNGSVFTGGLIDINSNDTIFTRDGNGIEISVSHSGKYILISELNNKTLYYYDGNLTKLHDLGSDYFIFNPVNEEEIYRFSPGSDNSISILQCSNMQVVKSGVPSMSLGQVDIDPITGMILIVNQSDVYLYDIDRKTVVNAIKIVQYWEQSNYALFNNTLFSRLGYKLSLSQ